MILTMIRLLDDIGSLLTKEISGIFTCFSDDFGYTLTFAWLIIVRPKNSMNNFNQLPIRDGSVINI